MRIFSPTQPGELLNSKVQWHISKHLRDRTERIWEDQCIHMPAVHLSSTTTKVSVLRTSNSTPQTLSVNLMLCPILYNSINSYNNKFNASSVYKASSRTARVTKRDPLNSESLEQSGIPQVKQKCEYLVTIICDCHLRWRTLLGVNL